MYDDIPVFGVAKFGFSEVDYVISRPGRCLLPTYQEFQLIGGEHLKSLHGEYPVKTS